MDTPIIHTYQYGTGEIISFERGDLGTVWRIDLYTSNSNREQTHEKHFASSMQDNSRLVNRSEEYTPECSACWLGFGHTIEYHNQNKKA